MSFSRVQGGKHPSMEGVEEQQDGADANDAAQNEGIPSLPEVDPLDQAVHCWKTVSEGSESRPQQQTGIHQQAPKPGWGNANTATAPKLEEAGAVSPDGQGAGLQLHFTDCRPAEKREQPRAQTYTEFTT